MDKRDYISVRDARPEAIEALLDIAEEMRSEVKARPRRASTLLQGHVMASLFLEPSTRTRMSFDTAIQRLGGGLISLADAEASSLTKGETLQDSVRMVSSYADLIVMRHPQAGAARIAADVAGVPVVNAGDGGHEHPTQTLCDLFALRRLKGRLQGLRVILYGDLKYGRTTHSLALALARAGSEVLCLAESGLELPGYVASACLAEGGLASHPVVLAGTGTASWLGAADREALLLTRDPETWGARDGRIENFDRRRVDALYATRLQRERLAAGEKGMEAGLPAITPGFLEAPALAEAIVLHPLPRVDEIHPSVDRDPRAAYFRQAAWGVPVRMALLASLAGATGLDFGRSPADRAADEVHFPDIVCRHANCVAARGLLGEGAWGRPAEDGHGGYVCAYCDAPLVRD